MPIPTVTTEMPIYYNGNISAIKTRAISGFEQTAPYTMAQVQMEEGPVVTAQLTDHRAQVVEIGMPLEMVTRKIHSNMDERGIIVYGQNSLRGDSSDQCCRDNNN